MGRRDNDRLDATDSGPGAEPELGRRVRHLAEIVVDAGNDSQVPGQRQSLLEAHPLGGKEIVQPSREAVRPLRHGFGCAPKRAMPGIVIRIGQQNDQRRGKERRDVDFEIGSAEVVLGGTGKVFGHEFRRDDREAESFGGIDPSIPVIGPVPSGAVQDHDHRSVRPDLVGMIGPDPDRRLVFGFEYETARCGPKRRARAPQG